MAKRAVMFLTEDQLRAYVRNRDRRKRSEERALIRSVLEQATPEELAELLPRFHRDPFAED